MIGVFAIATIVALALQTTLTRLLPFEVLMPNLALILTVTLGLRHYSAAAALMAFGIGYAADTFSGTQLGLNAALFTLVFILTYWASRVSLSNKSGLGVIATFIGVVLVDFGNVLSADWKRSGNFGQAVPAILAQATVTAVCAPMVFGLMAGATRLVGLRQRSLRE